MQWADAWKELRDTLPYRIDALNLKGDHLSDDAKVKNDGQLKELEIIRHFMEQLEVKHA